MTLSGTRGSTLLLLAGGALLAGTGCATLRRPKPRFLPEAVALKQTDTLLTLGRQTGWKEVEDLLPLLQVQADADFPALPRLSQTCIKWRTQKRRLQVCRRSMPPASLTTIHIFGVPIMKLPR